MESQKIGQNKPAPEKSQKNGGSRTKPGKEIPVTFNVTVPDNTASSITAVYLVGSFNEFSPNLPNWDPRGLAMKRLMPNRWSITLQGQPQIEVEYKYTLGSWRQVETDTQGNEIPNRHAEMQSQNGEILVIEDTVQSWR